MLLDKNSREDYEKQKIWNKSKKLKKKDKNTLDFNKKNSKLKKIAGQLPKNSRRCQTSWLKQKKKKRDRKWRKI